MAAVLLPHCSSACTSKNHHIRPNTFLKASQTLKKFPSSSSSCRILSSSLSVSAPVDTSNNDVENPSIILTSTVGSPSPPPSSRLLQWNIDSRYLFVLNAVACVVAISTSCLFFSAIPALLAFKRAAESLEKLLDVTRKELPDTMAAVRLSGMEISDLTMELSDLGQEITQGVRSCTRAVRLAEDRLCRLTMSPTDLVQVQTTRINKVEGPPLAKNARLIREGIVKGRVTLGLFSSFGQFSKLAWNFLVSRLQRRSQ